ncbi:GH15 family glucan-1,4-alpha-glucosidase [Litorimonas taeanensis]|uniref:GH15 family glucan-1,4-alpha-glucosidase n=1 Tax=Litorimonas taeanensis TaxID=568099 RepID=A0A420WFM5_9PROT|nr:glycoside hydrolase family 15 protein [Litorimonas taeanensis]RKQ69798.1 GH15 family glucan-1,4-alpha-glucosidase [Litorimonas taeanensis]
MSHLNQGIIGNSTVAALIDTDARINWLCLPKIDGEPIFDALLGGKGSFNIWMEDRVSTEQSYEPNTAVLRTRLTDAHGAILDVIDFAPYFVSRDRNFRPASFVREIKVIAGSPCIKIEINAQANWGEHEIKARRGVHHISYDTNDGGFRITTSMPVSYILSRTSFVLDRDVSFICGPDESVAENVDFLARDWRERTIDYWRRWTRSLAVPPDWQAAVIRAAITLKLCVYEETGGVVAALTTSVPEHEGSQRNWDYRFCWIRDAYFSVTALNRLASMETLEHYMRFLRSVVSQTKGGHIQPVYGIGLETDLTEDIATHLPGYRGYGPVRRGNQAAEHIQHDVYGQIVLAATQAFLDERLLSQVGVAEFEQLEPVGERAFAVHDTPDAGIWEFRTLAYVHTSSAIMCWAACDRLSKIANYLKLEKKTIYWAERAEIIHKHILSHAFNEEMNAFTASYGGDTLDASVLLMAEIGFLPASDPRYIGTVEAVDRDLREGNHIYRYKTEDDFGRPQTAFTACTFWHIDALYRIGRKDEAREMFETILEQRNHLGLLSEDVDPKTNELWGNYPQTYSMVGIINSANLMSRKWTDIV